MATSTPGRAAGAAGGPGDCAAGPYRLALVGAGPSATYVMERLSAAAETSADRRLEVHVFDRGGEFGAGRVHSWSQPTTSFLNRISAQIGFAADESVLDAGPLRPLSERPTLYEWCRQRFAETGHPDFDLRPADWPKRYVHGLALSDRFAAFVADLRSRPGAVVELHATEVVDVAEQGRALRLRTADGGEYDCDEVLLLTGHSHTDPTTGGAPAEFTDFARRTGAHYIPYAYPLDQALPEAVSGPDRVVACAGMGLTAIDEILHLTEGRGGRFEQGPDDTLTYRSSGAEPAAIVAFSPTGVFTYARPHNDKEQDLARLEHRGVFLTVEALDRLRDAVGTPAPRGGGTVGRQLDFEPDVLPLVLLEMAHLHYATLFGPGTAAVLTERVAPGYRLFLDGGRNDLLAPLEAAVDELTALLEKILSGSATTGETHAGDDWPLEEALARWAQVVFGPEGRQQVLAALGDPGELSSVSAGLRSPWRLEESVRGNRFDWAWLTDPLGACEFATPEEYRRRFEEFMAVDHLWAAQGNLDNPAKAAADGVWRDLRQVLGHAIDDAGLTARSHRLFLERYMRHHNKLANGAAREVMEKILALVRHGLLDIGTGPDARVTPDESSGKFLVSGPRTGASRLVDTLVDARVHAFDPRRDVLPLYRRLLERGLIRIWRNTSADGSSFEPGGIDLTPEFHPVRADGTEERRITALGPPSEGAMFFQLGALRPDQNHHVMRDVLVWLQGFRSGFRAHHLRSQPRLPASRPEGVLS
ncbi:FAD/NAD(P)-binding protein [Streptomyces castrisilvae]|uniref:FAD/NAD(P)-binding protein n=1 Tax=Streptomyces castrisilvae TaxID=3033811 RepID=UPI0035324423